MIDLEQIEKAYNRLSMLHSETMLDNVRLREQIKHLSGDWFRQFKYWLRVKLGLVKEWGDD